MNYDYDKQMDTAIVSESTSVLGGWTSETLEEVVMMSERDFGNGRVRSNEEVMKYLLEKSQILTGTAPDIIF